MAKQTTKKAPANRDPDKKPRVAGRKVWVEAFDRTYSDGRVVRIPGHWRVYKAKD